MRKALILLASGLFFCGTLLQAQKEGAVWYFGQNAGLDFNQYYPKPLTDGQINTREGVAAICDKDGNLLFYTDGKNVYNRNHQVMANGEGLYGDESSTQSSIVVPSPGKLLQYHIFTVDKVGTTSNPGKGLNYSTVDLINYSPLGRVMVKNQPLMPASQQVFTEKITAVKHRDGESYWIIAHGFNNWAFYVFKLDRNGLHQPDIYTEGSQHVNTDPNDRFNRGATGYLKSSPKGDFLAVAVEARKFFELFSFNNLTGKIEYLVNLPAGSRERPLTPTSAAYGVEFSPTGNYFYGSTREGGLIYQWNLSNIADTNSIRNSMRIIRENRNILCGALQLGFNGKIYVAFGGTEYLGVINSPIQEDCNYIEHGASLFDNETGKGGRSYFGLPTFLPDFFKAAEFYFENTCQNDTTIFYLSTRFNIESIPAWTIYDKTGTQMLHKVEVNPETLEGSYRFTSPGEYIVELKVKQFGSDINQRREITIHSLPELNFPDTTSLCKGTAAILDAGYGAFYSWRDNPNLNVVRYRTIYNPGKYVVTVQHYNGCINTDSTYVAEKPLPVVIDTVVGMAACGYDNGSIELFMEKDLSLYEFTWKDFPDNHTNKATGLKGGAYEITVTSKETGCQAVQKITVSEAGAPNVSIRPSITGPVCAGSPVTLTASGAQNYIWYNSDSTKTESIVIKPWATDTYIVEGYAFDVNGQKCRGLATLKVEVLPFELPDLGADKSVCEGDTVKLDGGQSFTAWEWANGETSQKIRLTESYPDLWLRVTDRNGCQFSDTILVTVKPTPVFNLGNDRIICKGTEVRLDAGVADSVLWNTGAKSRYIEVLETDIYAVTVWKNGCSASDQVVIRVNSPDSLRIDSVRIRDISCNGAADGSIRIFARGEGSFYEYSIDDGVTFMDNQGMFQDLDPGSGYRIRIREDSVCMKEYDKEIEIREPDPIEIDYRMISPSCDVCEDGEISLILTGGTPPYSILWSTLDSLRRLRNIGLGTYPVWIRDASGCSSYKNIVLEMGHATYSIPNAFTPNGDGINERWEIPALKDKPDCVVQVYNRTGRRLFESEKGYPVPWDGRDPDGNIVPVGSYFYIIRVTEDSKPVTGTVTVLK